MNKKEFVEQALRVFSPSVADPKAFFEELYDRSFREIEEKIKAAEERIGRLSKDIEEINKLLRTS